jgi:hypothetical protein
LNDPGSETTKSASGKVTAAENKQYRQKAFSKKACTKSSQSVATHIVATRRAKNCRARPEPKAANVGKVNALKYAIAPRAASGIPANSNDPHEGIRIHHRKNPST